MTSSGHIKHKKKFKQQELTLAEYNAKLKDIISKAKPVSETLIELLEEASKYKIVDKK